MKNWGIWVKIIEKFYKKKNHYKLLEYTLNNFSFLIYKNNYPFSPIYQYFQETKEIKYKKVFCKKHPSSPR